MSMKTLYKITFGLGIFAGIHMQAASQINNSLYFMHGVPQANRINPAHQPNCGFYLGFPGLAPVRMEVTSSSFAWQDIMIVLVVAESLKVDKV